MPSLIEKMEASAAARLTLPPGRLPAEELARFRNFLKVESHRLRLRHRAGLGGRAVCRARAALIDILLRFLWQAARNSLSAQAQREFPPLCLIALGGYGRGELSPHSDIDIMFLHAGQVVAASKPLPHLSKLMDSILYPLWDLGFKIGHSVRTLADCVSAANDADDKKSMETKTSLIEARLVVGDAKLFERFQKVVVTKCVDGYEAAYLAARLEDQAARRAKFGNSATMQEPNLKNGCGGLRDFQNLHWMAFFKYRTRSLEEMEARGLIRPIERRQLEAAYDFLLAVRNELHYQTNRPVDVLAKSLQPAVALALGYTDRSPRRRIERFMRDLYQHTRNLYLITRTLEERLALVPPSRRRLPSIRRLLPRRFLPPANDQVIDGFKISGDQIHAVHNRVFRDQPRRLMRVFLHAQQRGLRLHPDLAQSIRGDLVLVDRAFRRDPHVRDTFLEILNRRGNVAPSLRSMHEVGLLGKYLPEFGRLTCLVQHEFYHQYAADEHTLMCLAKLDEVWEAQAPAVQPYAHLFQTIERPFVLYLALLLHDAGKACQGPHSEIGGQLALQVARRLDLDGATAHSLRLLIEQHLTMAQTSQRRDLEAPEVIRAFATQVQTIENLRMLTLHTYADSLATSDKLWNGFKDSLLWMLYHKTERALLGGTDFIRAEEKQRQLLAEEVGRLLPPSFKEDELAAHFSSLPARYFQIHNAREVMTDLALAHRFMHLQLADDDKRALEPIIAWHNEPDRGFTSAKICTWNRAGLFSKIAGSFTAAGINILGAQVFSRSDGIVLDTFYVADARTGGLVSKQERERFEAILVRALTEDGFNLHSLIDRQPRSRPPYQLDETEGIPTRISFDNTSSPSRTVIDLETEDCVGLLHAVSEALSGLGLDISLAKIATEKGAAIDSFYVAEIDGGKIETPARQQQIESRLRQVIAALQAPSASTASR
ncbi:MAG TPA: [protein-PII] uridylyltransferase [Methylomirabilota bacterium]|nr:[protein-PII] uridylyltransferase [Methylomirabilota bacterium]